MPGRVQRPASGCTINNRWKTSNPALRNRPAWRLRVKQELRLDTVKLRRVEQRFKDMLEQGLFDFVSGP
jgi:hypothetical protein